MVEELPPLLQRERPEEGACWNCGFLCRKDEHNRHLESFIPISTRDREWAKFFLYQDVWAPWCFRYQPIMYEITEALGSEPQLFIRDGEIQKAQNAATLEVVVKKRDCPKWTKYKPGLSPKDHAEELFMRELEELRHANALKLAELDQRSQKSMRKIMAYQANIMEDHRATTEALKEIIEKANSETNRWQWAFFGIAALAIILAVGSLLYPNGLSWLDWLPGQVTQSQQSIPDTATPQPQPTS